MDETSLIRYGDYVVLQFEDNTILRNSLNKPIAFVVVPFGYVAEDQHLKHHPIRQDPNVKSSGISLQTTTLVNHEKILNVDDEQRVFLNPIGNNLLSYKNVNITSPTFEPIKILIFLKRVNSVPVLPQYVEYNKPYHLLFRNIDDYTSASNEFVVSKDTVTKNIDEASLIKLIHIDNVDRKYINATLPHYSQTRVKVNDRRYLL